MKLDWFFPDSAEWDVTDEHVRVEFIDRQSASWVFPAIILAIISALEFWKWLNLQPLDNDPLILVWSVCVLAVVAIFERRIPSLSHITASGSRAELHDSDENMVSLAARDEIAAEIEQVALGEKTMWSVRLSGPSLDLETPFSSTRQGPHNLARAMQKVESEAEVTHDAELPDRVTCPKVRTYGGLALLIWMLGLAAIYAIADEPWWWVEPLIGCILVLPYAIHGLMPSLAVRLRANPEGHRMARVGFFGRWYRVDELFVGLRGNAVSLCIFPHEFVREGREIRIALYRMLAPTILPREGVAGAFSFARELRGREASRK